MNRICLVAATVLASWTMTAGPALACTELPAAIQVDDFLAPVVDELLAVSPTFSRQCERIAAVPLVRVAVRMLPKGEEYCCRARTTIRRFASGVLIALVEIPSPRRPTEYAELLGHEFEHILEQIDLVDLSALAQQGGASRFWDGAYETERARSAGAAVAEEAATAAPALAERSPSW
jgi:hypothetical protein